MKAALPAAIGVLGLVQAGALAMSPDPAGFALPLTQRLLYVHVPLAWTAYIAFAALTLAAVVQLARPHTTLGAHMTAAAETATPIVIAAIATGIVWAREFGNYDPFRDPKLIATFVLLLALTAITLLAHTARPEARDRLLASMTLMGAFTVPASYLASRISVHPDLTAPGQSLESAAMWGWLLASTIAWALTWAALAHVRIRLDRAQTKLARQEASTT